MDNPPADKFKRGLLHFIQSFVMAVFVAIAAYGALTYWGGETNQKLSMEKSLLLGLLALICVGINVYIGWIQDRSAHREDILKADGAFDPGDKVLLKDKDGLVLAVGKAGVSSEAYTHAPAGKGIFSYIRVLN